MASGTRSRETAVETVREFARRGEYAKQLSSASGAEGRWLRGGAYEIAWPVVFARLTRRLEIERGHPVCAASVRGLEPECLDRFEDDVEAVLDDLSRNATLPIVNLEGWITSRLMAATIDAHRRRRGVRGALQRPRLPAWLADALGHDRWLTVLAIEILTWVGVATTAGTGIWPLGAWSERRASITGDFTRADTLVAADVETVLAAMRRKPTWYLNYVERPLGRKQAPLLPAQRTEQALVRDVPCLQLVERHEVDDARLLALAEAAVSAIEARIGHGDEPLSVVLDVLRKAFGGGTGSCDLGSAPGSGPDDDERVTLLLADPLALKRIMVAVLDILSLTDALTVVGPSVLNEATEG